MGVMPSGRLSPPSIANAVVPLPPMATTFTLENRLEVVLVPLKDSSVLSTWVWYRVGSCHEHLGITGAAHWLEHMLFKGSRNHPPGSIDRMVVGAGGNLNAFTDLDFTAYVSVVPKDKFRIPLTIEADRMTGATIPSEGIDSERNVVLSEREMNENNPEFRVEEELYRLAYRIHPYRWNTLGYPRDIHRMDREKLADFYHRYYGPSNATLVVAGGFETSKMKRLVEKLFDPVPDVASPPPVPRDEPVQRSNQESTLKGPGSTPIVRIAWHAPRATDADAPAACILSAFLGGEPQLYTPSYSWGRSREHPSSLLYESMVDKDLAVSTGCEWQAAVHPGLFSIHARGVPGVSAEELERALLDTVETLKRKGISSTDLESVQRKFLVNASTVWTGTAMVGFRYGYFRSLGGSDLERDLLEDIIGCDESQVSRFASDMFDTGRVTVRFVPEEDKREAT